MIRIRSREHAVQCFAVVGLRARAQGWIDGWDGAAASADDCANAPGYEQGYLEGAEAKEAAELAAAATACARAGTRLPPGTVRVRV